MTRSRDVADTQANLGGAVAPFVAGKNKIINGDFNIWQRGTSFSNPSNGTYTADRFIMYADGSGMTRTLSRQTFTPGTAPVAGYEASYFFRFNQSVAGTGGSYNVIPQLIEDVRTLAGQTVTFSFWAKADASRSIITNVIQNFGSGGSSEVFVGTPISATLTTGWVRYSGTITMPSLSGKTIGTNSFVKVEISMPVNTVMTIDFWGWQFETGSVATPFTTASGSIGGELALCQRYYYRTNTGGSNIYARIGMGKATSTSVVQLPVPLPVPMRTAPSSVDFSTLAVEGAGNVSAAGLNGASVNCGNVDLTTSGVVTNVPYIVNTAGSAAGYIAFNAEL
jgi:hypothetical protein